MSRNIIGYAFSFFIGLGRIYIVTYKYVYLHRKISFMAAGARVSG